jgi:hypothetical protein
MSKLIVLTGARGPYPVMGGVMKDKIKSFILGVKEARRLWCTTVHGAPARRAYDMGRKLSNGFMDLLKFRMG